MIRGLPDDTNWSKLTPAEKDVAVELLLHTHKYAERRRVPHANDQRADVLAEAIATRLVASRAQPTLQPTTQSARRRA